MRQGPLAGRYPAVAAMVTLALIPYLALSAAVDPLVPIISAQLHMSTQAMSLGSGLGNAAYAVGTVLAVQFAQHLPQRRMLLAYAVVLVVGSVLAASALNGPMFICGHILQGLATSMLLIAAAPPLTIGFPRDKLRNTAVIMNMCVFGAVALGPFIGGVQAEANAWRPLFWIVAVIALLALVMAALTFEDAPPADLDAPRDLRAIGLASVGCAAAFIGASQLTSHAFTDPAVIVPMLGGLALIVVLIVYQFRSARPLLTVRTMLTSSIPVAGVGVALFAAAASVAATALTAEVFMQTYSPVRVGLLFLPELGGAIVMAFVFGAVISKRAMHYLPLVGMALLAAGIVVFRLAIPANQPLALLASALTGLALGATVAPALFVAGFSLQSNSLQRVFAIIELLRAVAAFMVAPIFAHFAATAAGGLTAGAGDALWVGFGLSVGGAVFGVAVYALSGARPQAPDLDQFLDGESPAWYSPPLLARLRPGLPAPVTPPHRARSVVPAEQGSFPLSPGPVLFAYDGTPRAASAIEQAAAELSAHRDALVVCVWQPVDVGFTPVETTHFDADQAAEVRRVAQRTADHGASLATRAGFSAQAVAVESAPIWKGIVETAHEHNASLIVVGPHRRDGLLGHLEGSVAAAVVAHSRRPVLVVPEQHSCQAVS
ncbi:universal stress protein [Mycolicibacterium neworleansense]|uniref:Transporter major facilitator family protein n=1 Tax=Mycolicibacterium neworleansense TaxID=146018 RepID=A0A0H5RSF5_9MYCO|nr:universal stress protein [Mycolicibacterium neworleansense]MCV7361500.1 MFS transporter [Mycolicibacterium neworleansense]CRZ16853.1 transporter major facilitator family protein [Mycolicibacterium neworleansense]